MKIKILYTIIGVLALLLVYSFTRNNIEPINKQEQENGLGCTRTKPYDNPPELVRALDFGRERNNVAPGAPTLPPGSYRNCIHLIYKDHNEMEGAEGFFTFDKTSSANDLRIYVDETYKNYDEILTASLLSHEIMHATFFVRALHGAQPLSCVENEAASFYSQLIFLTNLNEEEWKSLLLRISENPHLNSSYEMTYYLLLLNDRAQKACSNAIDQTCWNNYVLDDLKEWISSDPYYKKQCNL